MSEPVIDAAACAAWLISPVGRDTGARDTPTTEPPPNRDIESNTTMEYPAVQSPDLEEEDPDLAAILDALAHTYQIREALRPVMLRYEERRRCRLAKRLQRAKKNGTPAESEDAA